MMRNFLQSLFFILLLTALGVAGCNNQAGEQPTETSDSGKLYISCDESFKPAIDAQIQVFKNDHPNADIVVHYKPEADCLRDFLVDSIELVIVTRPYSAREKNLIADSLRVEPDYSLVAYDAIAVVVHPDGPQQFFDTTDLKNLLTGRSKVDLIPVLDGLSATSTVRYIIDSLLKGSNLGPNVAAATSSREVIEYVSRTPKAVGFVGIGWIGNADDTAQLNLLKKVRLARLESTDSAGGYVLPVQYLIYTKTYPLIRSLVYVLKEKNRGLAHAFAYFMRNDRGQLIFRRSYLFPAIHPFYSRDAVLE